jgi:hypothetical protein
LLPSAWHINHLIFLQVDIPKSASPESGSLDVAAVSPVTEELTNELAESSAAPIAVEAPVDDAYTSKSAHVDVREASIADAKSDSGTTAVADQELIGDNRWNLSLPPSLRQAKYVKPRLLRRRQQAIPLTRDPYKGQGLPQCVSAIVPFTVQLFAWEWKEEAHTVHYGGIMAYPHQHIPHYKYHIDIHSISASEAHFVPSLSHSFLIYHSHCKICIPLYNRASLRCRPAIRFTVLICPR